MEDPKHHDYDHGDDGDWDASDFEYLLATGYKKSQKHHPSDLEYKYRCFPLQETEEKPHLRKGNRIILPADSLRLYLSIMEPQWHSNVSAPMLFRVENKYNGKTTNCSVLEFTGSDQKEVFFPDWIILNLGLDEGEIVTLQSTTLEKATFIKLQPHTAEFLCIQNPKAVLEENLVHFSCLTVGDTISIHHQGKVFAVNVVEARPQSAVCIIDTDCGVDFLLPLDYKEDPEPEKRSEPTVPSNKFRPFTGLGRRLDGQQPSSSSRVEALAATSLGAKAANEGRDEGEEGANKKRPKLQAFAGKKV